MKLYNWLTLSVTLAMTIICISCLNKETIEASKYTLQWTEDGGRKTIDITANCSWSITAPSWVSVQPSSGNGSAEIIVRASKNQELERSGVLLISGAEAVTEIALSQEGVDFSIDRTMFRFTSSGAPVESRIISSYDWQIDIPEESYWVVPEPSSGKAGETMVVFTPAPITDRVPRDRAYVTVNYGNSFKTLTFTQPLPNSAPNPPELLSPENGAVDVKINSYFSWTQASDPDGDTVTYRLMLSQDDGATWTTTETSSVTERPFPIPSVSTECLWKVQAVDKFGAMSESQTYSFVTAAGGAYRDGEVSIYKEEKASAPKPVHLIFMGDGFISDDYVAGGAFDQAVAAAVNALFSVEPYASYKDYFRVSTVAVYSQERGATVRNDMIWVSAQQRNTAFESVLEGGNTTGVGCNYDKVFSYAMTVPGVDQTVIDDTAIFLLININAYAGTCLMDYRGRSVAMCPMAEGYISDIVCHEGVGHGFGRLHDEYRYNNETIPDDQKSSLEAWRSYDPYFAYNLDLTGDRTNVHWAHYFDRPGYESVDLFEGACYYYYGVWRSEKISCMEDNRAYYNAPSREAIVRRIMKASGSSFNLETFVANDKVRSDPTTRTANYVELSVPLAPPVMIQK